MARVELYFGGGGVSPGAWNRFIASVVTPRFPDGLTILDAHGQWRACHGLQREPARVVVIFYRPDLETDAKIETIRRLYKSRFRQSSVLRADSAACVGF
jgi:hypothetical protein